MDAELRARFDLEMRGHVPEWGPAHLRGIKIGKVYYEAHTHFGHFHVSRGIVEGYRFFKPRDPDRKSHLKHCYVTIRWQHNDGPFSYTNECRGEDLNRLRSTERAAIEFTLKELEGIQNTVARKAAEATATLHNAEVQALVYLSERKRK